MNGMTGVIGGGVSSRTPIWDTLFGAKLSKPPAVQTYPSKVIDNNHNQILEEPLEKLRITIFGDLSEKYKALEEYLKENLQPSEIEDIYENSLRESKQVIECLKTSIIECVLIKGRSNSESASQRPTQQAKDQALKELHKYLKVEKITILIDDIMSEHNRRVFEGFAQHLVNSKIDEAEETVHRLAERFDIDLKASLANRLKSFVKNFIKAFACLIGIVAICGSIVLFGKYFSEMQRRFVEVTGAFFTALCAFGITSAVSDSYRIKGLDKKAFDKLKQILVTSEQVIEDLKKITVPDNPDNMEKKRSPRGTSAAEAEAAIELNIGNLNLLPKKHMIKIHDTLTTSTKPYLSENPNSYFINITQPA